MEDLPNHQQAVEGLRHFLLEHQELIIEEWRSLAGTDDEMQRAHHLTREQFLDHIPQVMELLGEYLTSQDIDQTYFEKQSSLHGHKRWKQGFSLDELIYDWGHLRTVLLLQVEQYFEQNPELDSPVRRHLLLQLANFTNRAIGASVREFDQLRQSEAASLEADLLEARKEFDSMMRLRAELLHSATHDLRGSLSGVTGASAVVERLIQGDHQAEQARSMLGRSVESVRQMLDDLLDLARLEAGREDVKHQEMDPCGAARDIVDSFRGIAEKKGLELHLNCPEELRVTGDATAFRRIVQNLVKNGIEYTEEGSVTVTVCPEEHKHWKLEIKDTGPGIQISEGVPLAFQFDKPHAKKDDPHPVADPPTENYQGEGIGLTIVKRLCELLHANIRFDSQPNEGSVFTILFPLEYPSEDSSGS